MGILTKFLVKTSFRAGLTCDKADEVVRKFTNGKGV